METTATTTAPTDATGTQPATEAQILESMQGLSIEQLLSGESVNPEAGKHAPAPETASDGAEKSNESTEAKAGNQPQQEQPKREEKSDERAAKTWEEINREKAQLQAQREEIARAKAELQRTQELLGPEAKKALQTADDYDRFAKEWAEEGRNDLAQQAKERAAMLRRSAQEAQTQAQAAQLQAAQLKVMREVVTEFPELKDVNGDLHKGVEELMRRRPILNTYPEGVRDAVEAVRAKLEAKSAADLRKEIGELKEKLAAREKLLQPGTGAPSAASVEGANFDSLPIAEREKRLRLAVQAAETRGESVL